MPMIQTPADKDDLAQRDSNPAVAVTATATVWRS
jgi:hypothetical protein